MSPKTKIPIHIATTPSNTPQIRVVFMGTPELASIFLKSLVESKYNIVGVVTQPDRPVGRSQTLEGSPVKKVAIEHTLPLLQPDRLDADTIEQLKKWKPDLIVVVAYGRILPEAILTLPGFGCINVHMSLLPRWRGASPIQNALLSGDIESGVTIMLLDKGMDTGPILAQKSCPIDPIDRTDTLTEKLTSEKSKVFPRQTKESLCVSSSNAKMDAFFGIFPLLKSITAIEGFIPGLASSLSGNEVKMT